MYKCREAQFASLGNFAVFNLNDCAHQVATIYPQFVSQCIIKATANRAVLCLNTAERTFQTSGTLFETSNPNVGLLFWNHLQPHVELAGLVKLAKNQTFVTCIEAQLHQALKLQVVWMQHSTHQQTRINVSVSQLIDHVLSNNLWCL